jgi:arylsulfatase A-like enzyme
MEHTDHHVGRLIDALGPGLDDTLVYVIVGDNGASAEGTLQGAFKEMCNFNGVPDNETPELLASKLDEFGGERSYGHYAVGWAWAMDTPYQWIKQVASHWGGTRNGTLCTGPMVLTIKVERVTSSPMSSMWRTVLEAAGIPEPVMVNGVLQRPYEVTSCSTASMRCTASMS